jgi:sporulation protein YlmC with PRC-barrel domain
MRLSELLGTTVVTVDGETLGRVHDVLLLQDGPVGSGGIAGLRLHALAVGRRSVGTQLGFAQGTVEGPWLLRLLLSRSPLRIPWESVVERSDERIVVRSLGRARHAPPSV